MRYEMRIFKKGGGGVKRTEKEKKGGESVGEF